MHVCIGLARPAIERAKCADYVADIRVVDVAVDNVGDHVRWVLPHTDLMCGKADADEIVGFEKLGAVVCGYSLAREGFIECGLNILFHCNKLLSFASLRL